MDNYTFEYYGADCDPVAEAVCDNLKAEWVFAGEGVHGDYTGGSDDEELLRFYVFEMDDGFPVEISSFCTNIPRTASRDILEAGLAQILLEFAAAIEDGRSTDRVGQELSWMSLEDFA